MGQNNVRPPVQSMPHNARGTFMVTRERREDLRNTAIAIGMALGMVALPHILAALERLS